MQSDEVGDKDLYISFLSQIGVKPLKRVLEVAPSTVWESNTQLVHASRAVLQFKEKFWSEVAYTWDSTGKVRLSTICENTKRTPKYWVTFFENNPSVLLWVLEPLKDLLGVDPVIRGVLLKSRALIDSKILKRNGVIKTREAKMLVRLLELLCAKR